VSPGTSEKDIKANFSDGVLTLTVPKKQDKADKARRISIK
jgi:HSP20 family molecular chaperone IbpA